MTTAPITTDGGLRMPEVLDVRAGRARWRAVYAYWWLRFTKSWRGGFASGVVGPALYLAAMGVGLGSLVNHHAGPGRLGGVSYLDFVAPGLIAATAMQNASIEATWPVLGAIKWNRIYQSMLAGPTTVNDIVTGQLLWIATRVALSSAAYLAVVAAFGAVQSWWALLIVPAATLVGVAFATPIAAYTATIENEQPFMVIYRLGIVPLFLFSGSFFPISQLPEWMRVVAYVTPLWHGVTLVRDLSLGTLSLGPCLLHAGYLMLWGLAGYVAARRTFARRLVT